MRLPVLFCAKFTKHCNTTGYFNTISHNKHARHIIVLLILQEYQMQK